MQKKSSFLAIFKVYRSFLLNRLLLLIMCIYEYDTIRQYTFIILFGKKIMWKKPGFMKPKILYISVYMRIKGIDMSHIKYEWKFHSMLKLKLYQRPLLENKHLKQKNTEKLMEWCCFTLKRVFHRHSKPGTRNREKLFHNSKHTIFKAKQHLTPDKFFCGHNHLIKT